jgi:hypothetical protein
MCARQPRQRQPRRHARVLEPRPRRPVVPDLRINRSAARPQLGIPVTNERRQAKGRAMPGRSTRSSVQPAPLTRNLDAVYKFVNGIGDTGRGHSQNAAVLFTSRYPGAASRFP